MICSLVISVSSSDSKGLISGSVQTETCKMTEDAYTLQELKRDDQL